MKYCPACKAEPGDDFVECPSCGELLVPIEDKPAPTVVVEKTKAEIKADAKKGKWGKK